MFYSIAFREATSLLMNIRLKSLELSLVTQLEKLTSQYDKAFRPPNIITQPLGMRASSTIN